MVRIASREDVPITEDRDTYHRRGRQAGLGRLTPIEFETIYSAADAA